MRFDPSIWSQGRRSNLCFQSFMKHWQYWQDLSPIIHWSIDSVSYKVSPALQFYCFLRWKNDQNDPHPSGINVRKVATPGVEHIESPLCGDQGWGKGAERRSLQRWKQRWVGSWREVFLGNMLIGKLRFLRVKALRWIRNSYMGGFHKWGCPLIIHFNRIFPYKPSILIPHLWKPWYECG